MRLPAYLASKGLTLCFLGVGGVLLFLFLAMQEVSAGAILFVEASLLLIVLLWLLTGFLVQRRRYGRLTSVISQLDEKYLLGEVLPKPASETELVYHEVMKTVSSGAIEAVERARRERDEYELSVESWVHEIKTPLTACSLIIRNGGDVQKIRREIKRADNIVENILYYARLKSPEKDTVICPVSVAEVVGDTLRDQLPLLTAAGVSVETSGDFTVNTDDKALEFILKQLLCNSAKYCEGCHIVITAENGVLRYEDDGVGIPAHELSRVTERGFTGVNGRTLGNSTGMGLYLASGLCDHLGITLTIESEVGRYSRFCLKFA